MGKARKAVLITALLIENPCLDARCQYDHPRWAHFYPSKRHTAPQIALKMGVVGHVRPLEPVLRDFFNKQGTYT